MSGRRTPTIDCTVRSGAAVVRAGGDLDVVTAPQLRRVLDQAVATGLPLVLVDLAELEFLDSLALSVLVAARRSLAPGQRLGLANVPARLQRVLGVAGMSTLFTVHEQGAPWPWPEHPVGRGAPTTAEPAAG